MNEWKTGEAKQRFSEVLRRSRDEPQRIFRRNELVAAVVSAGDFEEFTAWRTSRRRKNLDEMFDEVREISARYDYELNVGERRDREAWDD